MKFLHTNGKFLVLLLTQKNKSIFPLKHVTINSACPLSMYIYDDKLKPHTEVKRI